MDEVKISALRNTRTILEFDAGKAVSDPQRCVFWCIQDGSTGSSGLKSLPPGTLASVALSLRAMLGDVEAELSRRGFHWHPEAGSVRGTLSPAGDSGEAPITGEYRRIRMEGA